jgi:hypothetical protein
MSATTGAADQGDAREAEGAMIDLDDQIRLMAAIIAAGLLSAGSDEDYIATRSVDIAASIHDCVNQFHWQFSDQAGNDLQPHPQVKK